jgi:hypothetical protein
MEMADGTADRRGARWLIALITALVLATVVVPLVIHFGQKRHDVLPFDVTRAFPADRPLVGGEAFASTAAALMDHELSGFTGWRPNDFPLWGPGLWADNNANRQRGIILALRESVRVFKDHLTKVSSNEYDPNLVAADTAFRNDAEKFWLPSAESKFRAGVRYLQAYVEGLKTEPPRSRPIVQRNIELIRLCQAWNDLLGDAHASLFAQPDSTWHTDDAFYRAQGVAHVIGHLAAAVGREYRREFYEVKPVVGTMLDDVIAALSQAAVMKPLVVLDGAPDGILANHRRNLDAYITEARQKIYSIREELEK